MELMRTYYGTSGGKEWHVFWSDGDDSRFPLPLCLELRNHSPRGFAWGYLGSGPAQLALALLNDVCGSEQALQQYQQFKSEIIARIAQHADWTMTGDDILAWLCKRDKQP